MLILASASPRRRELLRLITPDFQVFAQDIEETLPQRSSPEQAVRELARQKAEAALSARPDDVVIGADTLVEVDGRILGKPASSAEAAETLSLLSGRRHRVYTGVAVLSSRKSHVFAEGAQVEFAPLSPRQIDAYIATGEPMDKAGAYGVQGYGALLVRAVYGDYYTVMGLPVCALARYLSEAYEIGWL